MSPYPIGYEADFAEERSRLTTFFRYIMAIPLYIVGAIYGIGAMFTIVIAWFALLFTARYPEGLYSFNSGVLRYFTRLNAYTRLLTDVYPPFDTGEHPEYPIRVPIAPAKESYSRAKVFFRYILGIPVILINYALTLLANICALLAWFVIVFTGKQSKGLQDSTNLGTAYGARGGAYFFLLTEDWPPFSVQENAPPASVPTA
jgi:Domain of unknown function (DUF4389)